MKSRLAVWAVFALCGVAGVMAMPVAQSLPVPALLVGEKAGGLVAIVDPATKQIVARIPANNNVHEIATDGRFAYVSNTGANAITVVDLVERRQVDPIPLGPLGTVHGLWFAAGKLYFASEPSMTLGRYDPAAKTIDWMLGTGQRSHMLVVTGDGSRIFTTNANTSSMSIVEPGPPGRGGGPGPWTSTQVPAGRGIEGLDPSPDYRELWGVNVQEKTITVVNVADRKVVATIPFEANYSNRLRFTRDGRHVLATDFKGTDVIVFDAATRKEVKRINVGGGAEGVLVAPDGATAYVAVSGTGKVAVVDLATLTVTDYIGDFQNPDGLAWAASRP